MIAPSEIFMMVIGAAMALSGVPQIFRLIARQSAADISLSMFVVLFCGQACWIGYGLVYHIPSVILMNSISFLISGTIIVLAIRFRK